ncbi:MAG: hypothetical protein WAN01_04070 [Bradyrhizobium sp.]|jgi:hypothetical protein
MEGDLMAAPSLKTIPGWKTFEVASGHDVTIDRPDRLVEILLEVA